MAMTAVEDATKTAGKFSISSGAGTYTVTYQLKFTGTYSEGELMALLGTNGLPAASSAHPDDSNAYATSIEGDLADGSVITGTTSRPGLALITYTYAPNVIEDLGDAPLDRAPEIEWSGTDITEAATVDRDGNPIVNSAGDLCDPLPERYIRGGDCTVTMNVEDNPADTIVNFSYTVNNATWNGLAAGKGLIGKISARKVRETWAGSEYVYWTVTFPLRFNPNGWERKLIDNGYRKLVDDEPRAAHDDMGTPTFVPILLNGEGGELASGGTPVVYPEDGYPIEDETDWSSLGLPNVFA